MLYKNKESRNIFTSSQLVLKKKNLTMNFNNYNFIFFRDDEPFYKINLFAQATVLGSQTKQYFPLP